MITALLLTLAVAADPVMPVRTTAPWTIEVGPGSVELNGRTITLSAPQSFVISPAVVLQVYDEKHDTLPVFNENAGGWSKGLHPDPIKTEECSQTGSLIPGTFVLKPDKGDAQPFTLDKDYRMDEFWASIGRIDGGGIDPAKPVYFDYKYSPCRIDSIVADAQGKLRLIEGVSANGIVLPPELTADETAVVNVWIPSQCPQLTDDNLFPVYASTAVPPIEPVAEQCLPKTLAKLRAGEDVHIVAFGDSVTCGGGTSRAEDWYQEQFRRMLQERFPNAKIHMHTAGWGGASSNAYLTQPRGAEHDFVRDVLEVKPDMVTIEFVNDAYLNEEQTLEHYRSFISQIHGVGAEVVLITPHLVRPDWMNLTTMKVKEDPRPYVAGLRRLAKEDNLALADASQDYCNLWKMGIPYMTLMANAINHPD
ncbi:MAG: SGNH/GDSL hydrolase family protein, partial [Candidatus Hydrogenedentes bacterium]|nr:SGNH/GDSL hydrolase family protein [Candidatus Hydrogenedentota bacterium]